MKKLIVLFLLLTTLFSVSACGKGKAKTSSSEFSSESTSSESSFVQSSENSSSVLDSSSVVEELGAFYSLQKAYDNGYITVADLQTIAKGEELDVALVPSEVIDFAKTLYYNDLCEERKPNGELYFPYADINDLDCNILFYGEFNGAYCFRIHNPYVYYQDNELEEIVAGIVITYSGPGYVIWKK